MKYVSIVALVAAMAMPFAAQAQDVSVSASASGEVSVSAPDVSSALSSAVSSVSSEVSSAVSSVSSEISSAVSSASSELSSAMSSEMSSEMSSSASMASSGMDANCDNLDIATMNVGPIDAAALAAVTSVTIFVVDDCSGLRDLATMDATALAAVSTNMMVTDALTAQGNGGAEVIAYMLDGTSLTVYVRSRNQ